jgi:hypothetical protein
MLACWKPFSILDMFQDTHILCADTPVQSLFAAGPNAGSASRSGRIKGLSVCNKQRTATHAVEAKRLSHDRMHVTCAAFQSQQY